MRLAESELPFLRFRTLYVGVSTAGGAMWTEESRRVEEDWLLFMTKTKYILRQPLAYDLQA